MRHVTNCVDVDQQACAGHNHQPDRGETVDREIHANAERARLNPVVVMLAIGVFQAATKCTQRIQRL